MTVFFFHVTTRLGFLYKRLTFQSLHRGFNERFWAETSQSCSNTEEEDYREDRIASCLYLLHSKLPLLPSGKNIHSSQALQSDVEGAPIFNTKIPPEFFKFCALNKNIRRRNQKGYNFSSRSLTNILLYNVQ